MADIVGKITGASAEKCGTLLLDILKSSRFTGNTSLFSSSAATYALRSSDNIFLHPFLGNVKYPASLSAVPAVSKLSTSSGAATKFSLYDEVLLPFRNFFMGSQDVVTNSLKGVSNKLSNTGHRISSTISSVSSTVSSKASNFVSRLIAYASSFVGKVNNDRTGNRLFSDGVNRAWCMDFVRSCLEKVYGKTLPSWFNSSRCYDVAQSAKRNNAWIGLKGSTKKEKGDFIAQNIKPGDVMIQLKDPNKNSSGHTGIVKSINEDGSFVCVEGNSHDSVREVTYKPDNKTLRGFIRV